MSTKRLRVYELAQELGLERQELVTKINSLGLGLNVSNVMTVLSTEEIDKVKRAIQRETKAKAPAPAPAAAAEPASGPTVRRRNRGAEDDAPAEAPVEAAPAVGPTVRKRPKTTPVVEGQPIEPATRPIEPVSAEALEAAPAPTLETPAAKPAPAVAAAPEAVAPITRPRRNAPPIPTEPVGPARPGREFTPPTRVVETPKAEPRREARGEGRGEGRPAAPPAAPVRSARPTEAELIAAQDPAVGEGEGEGEGDAARRRGGAQIVGRIDIKTLESRLEDERDFGPPGRRPGGPAGQRRGGTPGAGAAGRPRPAGGATDPRFDAGNDAGRRWVESDSLGGRGRRAAAKGKRGAREDRSARGRQLPKKTEITQAAEHKRIIRIEDAISVGDLAHQMGVKAGQVAMKLLDLGMMATVNTTIDVETAELVAEQFDYKIENVAFDISKFYDTVPDEDETRQPRPPIVTVMGHVDHGKTSLLDAIRASDVTAGEAGGITQHIGAYTVTTERGDRVTFLDTPGHEAFTALRARGAQATDIVILVVAADDGVMPQTVEAINHSRAAGVPIIVAINKVDKPAANPLRVKQALMEYELVDEGLGGSTIFVEVSAKQRINIDKLLEMLMLQAEIEDLRARPDRDAQGLVIESELDTGRGPTATILVRRGTLRVGDTIVIGEHYGRVRTMSDHTGADVQAAGPSIPVVVTGLSGVPEAGEPFFVVDEERHAKTITAHVAEQRRKERMAAMARSNMDRLRDMLRTEAGAIHSKLKLIVKADVQGSIEALKQAFSKLGNEEVSVSVIHSAVGGITENDVNLAASVTDTAVVIVGFNTRPDNRASEVAEQYNVEIITCSIIYDAIDRIRDMLEGLLKPIEREKVIGRAEVRETFTAPKVGTIAGCYVLDGFLRRNARARLVRAGRVIYESSLGSLRRFKDDVREVKSGFECGTSLDNYNDIKIGDIIEAYEIEEVAATL